MSRIDLGQFRALADEFGNDAHNAEETDSAVFAFSECQARLLALIDSQNN